MAWSYSIDVAGFNWVHHSLKNPFFDWLMPILSGNPWFYPVLFLIALSLVWKGGTRGRLFLLAVMLVTLIGDGLICSSLKHWIGRQRPYEVVPGVQLLVGATHNASMPSSHAANWFAAAVVAGAYWRRSLWIMLPLASAISFSRVYNGVHYPSDIVVGALLACGYAALSLWGLNQSWQYLGCHLWPKWWCKLPSLLNPDTRVPAPPNKPAEESQALDGETGQISAATEAKYWLNLGYFIIALLLLLRLAYLASGQIELSEDEAYQWTWSKHLALSYYSKPPLIAYVQFLGTHLWGDNAFGVRFFSPVISSLLSLILLRFFAREVNARAGFWLIVIAAATPLLSVGSILMTIDPLSVLFWTAAMVSGWRAVQSDSTRYWLWTGLWMGLGFLSKYTGLFQLLCWCAFFVLYQPARLQLKRRGPYLGLGIIIICTLPVVLWNYQHGWITVTHVATDGGLYRPWQPSLRFFWDFLGAETGLLNPVFFFGALWAAIAIWRRPPNGLLIYLFCMGAPLFLFFLAYTAYSRVLPNWIAPSVVPLLCVMVIHWDGRWRAGAAAPKRWLTAGLAVGLIAVALLHDTDLIGKVAHRPLPPKLDPLKRVRAWRQTAQQVGEARQRLLEEGKPVFLIATHYGLVGELSFYLPAARTCVAKNPLVYYQRKNVPENQYYFWPGYQDRHGENAICVMETDRIQPAPESLRREFASIQDLGMREIQYHGRVFRRLQLFACRELKQNL